MNELCDCSCAHPCPLSKSGKEFRCKFEDLMDYFECDHNSVLDELHKWQRIKIKAILNQCKKGISNDQN